MLVIKKYWLAVLQSPGWPISNALHCFLVAGFSVLLPGGVGYAQQVFSFTAGGRNYKAEISWIIKHNNTDYKSKSTHTFDLAQSGSFDLAVTYKFQNDSFPRENEIVWGFQYNQTGDLLTPPAGEKRSKSNKYVQRFEFSETGNASLNITPKAWLRNSAGRFDIINQSPAFSLNFTLINSKLTSVAENPGVPNTPGATASPAKPGADSSLQNVAPLPPKDLKEERAFSDAASVGDTIQKIRALIDFVDKFSVTRPKSKLVAKAIKDIPLVISMPTRNGENTYTYTLDYPVNLEIDSAKVKGWRYNLTKAKSGKYQLVLTDLKDTAHYFTLVDRGKNAPFNLPKEIRPFEKIAVDLVGESEDSFRIRVKGGAPPFIVFLSQNGFPLERYIIEHTNTIRSFSKGSCERCKSGAYTLEVYTSDFSTLLLRVDKAIHIRKINFLLLFGMAVVGIPVAFFVLKRFRRFWQWLMYLRTLREIDAWEKKEIRDHQKNK